MGAHIIEDDVFFDTIEALDDPQFVFRRHSNGVYRVACSPTDASLVASGGSDRKGFLWKIGDEEGSCLHELEGHKEGISSMTFSWDGKKVATGSADGLIKIWDTYSGSCKSTLNAYGIIKWTKWHPSRNMILAGIHYGDLSMWNLDEHMPQNIFGISPFQSDLSCGDFTPDGEIVCTGSDDKILRIWKTNTGQCIHTVEGFPYHRRPVTCLSITRDSNFVLTGSYDLRVCIVNITTGKVVNTLISHTDPVLCIGISPSNKWVATGSMDSDLIIWDLDRAWYYFKWNHRMDVMCLQWLGENCIATGCEDMKVRVFDVRSAKCVRTFDDHRGPVRSMAASLDGKWIVSASADHTCRAFLI